MTSLTREAILERIEKGESLAGMDLSQADLS